MKRVGVRILIGAAILFFPPCGRISLAQPTAASDSTEQTHPQAEPGQIPVILARIASADFEERSAAFFELRKLASSSDTVGPLLDAVNQKLAAQDIASADWPEYRRAWDEAWIGWLQHSPPTAALTAPTHAALQDTLRQLLELQQGKAPENETHLWRRRQSLERLFKAWAVDAATLERMRAQLDAWSESVTAPALPHAVAAMRHELSPMLAAEIWSDRLNGRFKHVTSQLLVVGVPQHPEKGVRATHFSSANEKTAKLVEGNTLTPGDYPVGRAFPFEVEDQRFFAEMRSIFFIVYLPTPRDRWKYVDELHSVNEAERWRRICAATLPKIKAGDVEGENNGTTLREIDLWMIAKFSAREACDAALHGLQSWKDKEFFTRHSLGMGENSLYSALCAILTSRGESQAAKEILDKIEDGSLDDAAKQLQDKGAEKLIWIAALSAALRGDPVLGDECLVRLIRFAAKDNKQDNPLRRPTEDISAEAAGMLLRRHGRLPADFGVEVGEIQGSLQTNPLRNVIPDDVQDLVKASFQSPESIEKVLKWYGTLTKESDSGER